MKPLGPWRTWTPSLLFGTVVILLVALGWIQYQWFSRSAEAEIQGTIRTLESSLRQSVTREFQRYAPVWGELNSLKDTRAPSPDQVQAVVDAVIRTYGLQGTVAGLVAWTGYRVVGEPTYHRWAALGHGEVRPVEELFGANGSPLPGTSLIVGRTGNEARSIELFAAIDADRFFAAYVLPSLAELYPGATLGWSEATGVPSPGAFDSRTYAFSPLVALGSGSPAYRQIQVTVPKLVDLGPPGLPPGEPRKAFSSPRGPAGWTVSVTLAADAPVLRVENRLAWNWLGSTLLLLALGVAFGFVLRQSARSSALRRREQEFVASVSHELRTPLTVIRSAADNFSRGIVAPDRQQTYGQLILEQALRLGRMVEEMLSFAQSEGPARRVEAPIVFDRWLSEVRPPLDTLAVSQGITLAWDVAGIPSQGRTDPDAVRLILENLVVNAVNHAYPASAEGPKPVRITLKYLATGHLELTVDDDGRGIAAGEARKVFEPFYRDQVSRNTQEKGSGLGLFLAQRQARRMGGDLRLETPWRRIDGVKRPGCRFVATLPLIPQEERDGR